MREVSMAGMSGGSMLRTRRKDVNIKPNRKLDRKSSRGMLYENEELRLRTININAEVERGQTDIKKLKRENEQLRREISALRYEYERLDTLLRERSSSPQHSDDSGRSCCSACREGAPGTPSERGVTCARAGGGGAGAAGGGGLHVAFHDLSVVPEEEAQEAAAKSPPEGASCSCKSCKEDDPPAVIPKGARSPSGAGGAAAGADKAVDVLLHDAPPTSYLLTAATSPPPPGFHVPSPPAPGFNVNALARYNLPGPPPRFHTGGNIEDLLGDVEMGPNIISTEFIQQNSVFMCNTRKITHLREPCRCQKREDKPCSSGETQDRGDAPKYYVTEKNIELTYDYPRTTAIPQRSPSPKASDGGETTTEVASTVVFVERRYPMKPRSKFDFLFRSRSAPVGENEEPIYATVNKLPKRLQRRIELANLENEVSYRNGESTHENSAATERTDDTEPSVALPPDDDTSRSDRERPPPAQRPDTPKAKKRRRFSFTFKKRGDKKKIDKAKGINGGPTAAVVESDNERLLEGEGSEPTAEAVGGPGGTRQAAAKRCRHMRPRTIASSVSSGPRYKRDSYQEMTSHSERERTNSITSSINSNCSLATHKSRKLSAPPPDASIPWCGCWGTSCL